MSLSLDVSSRKVVGRIALVTGAASGIGRALACELHRRGAKVALVDRDETKLEEVRRILPGSLSIRADVSIQEEVASAVTTTEETLGDIDWLFSNAGVAAVGPVDRMPLRDWQWMVGVNLWGPVLLVREVLSGMKRRKRGNIVFTGSLAGLVGAPGMAAYSLTKFAVTGFADSLRHEVAPFGIDVSVVCPGYVRTSLHESTRYTEAGLRGLLDRAPAWYGLSAEDVAVATLDGASKGEPTIVLGPEKLAWIFSRIAPDASRRVSQWLSARLGLTGQA